MGAAATARLNSKNIWPRSRNRLMNRLDGRLERCGGTWAASYWRRWGRRRSWTATPRRWRTSSWRRRARPAPDSATPTPTPVWPESRRRRAGLTCRSWLTLLILLERHWPAPRCGGPCPSFFAFFFLSCRLLRAVRVGLSGGCVPMAQGRRLPGHKRTSQGHC